MRKSNYQEFWKNIFPQIKSLMDECCTELGETKRASVGPLDISEIKKYGDRRNWYGSVSLTNKGIEKANMAHAVALGKVSMYSGILVNFPNTRFIFRISGQEYTPIMLNVGCERIEEEPPKPPPPSPEDRCKEYFLIHRAFSRLTQQSLRDYSEKKFALPKDGILVFYEKGESYEHNGEMNPRIVRVESSSSEEILPAIMDSIVFEDRTKSRFRRLLGLAILKKRGASSELIGLWLHKDLKIMDFDAVEKEFGELLKSKFYFRFIEINDVEFRNFVKDWILSTLFSCDRQKISEDWLGRYTSIPEIIKKGIWHDEKVEENVNFNRYMQWFFIEYVRFNKTKECLRKGNMESVIDPIELFEGILKFDLMENSNEFLYTGNVRLRQFVEQIVSKLLGHTKAGAEIPSEWPFRRKITYLYNEGFIDQLNAENLRFLWGKLSEILHNARISDIRKLDSLKQGLYVLSELSRTLLCKEM